MSKKVTTEDFIRRARLVHGDKYDYSKVIYERWDIKVCIKCNVCGKEFWQRPNDHLCGKGCPHCSHREKVTLDMFIMRSINIHGFYYDYSRVSFNTIKDKVIIGCPVHGWFEQKVEAHMNGQGCIKCGYEKTARKRRTSQIDFVNKIKKKWGNEFDFSRVCYLNSKTKVRVGCKKHGWFDTLPTNLLTGTFPCRKCWLEKIGRYGMVTYDEFVYRANEKHNGKYNYSNVSFSSTSDKVEIICPKHGVFLQYVYSHLAGAGCPICNSSKGESTVERVLIQNNIDFVRQYKITNDNLICNNKSFYVDFYLPSYNIVIEYNGQQHYEQTGYFGGKEKLEKTQDRDLSLRVYCKEHGIKLVEIPYNEFDNIESILVKELKLVK